MTEPAVGASTCASGSQVCTGHIGTLTANEAKKAIHSHFCASGASLVVIRVGMSVVPAWKYRYISASSSSTEPARV